MRMGTETLVQILIVNWNGLQHLQAGLPSWLATRYGCFEIVLLDNGSTDGSTEWVQRYYPQVQVMALGSNRGFAWASNVGLRQAIASGAKYAVLLNNDTRVEPDWLDTLVDVAERDARIAVCQARQRTWEGDREIVFRFIPEWAEAEHELLPITPPRDPSPTAFASGCAMLLRCVALESIGLFDERYFMYVEDVDLSLRAWITGYQAMDVPAAVVYHRMGGSDSHAKQRMFWGYRNQLTTLLKLYEPGTLRWFAAPIWRRWFWTRNRHALRGTLAALVMLPGTLARRWQVQRQRQAPDRVFLDLCQI